MVSTFLMTGFFRIDFRFFFSVIEERIEIEERISELLSKNSSNDTFLFLVALFLFVVNICAVGL